MHGCCETVVHLTFTQQLWHFLAKKRMGGLDIRQKKCTFASGNCRDGSPYVLNRVNARNKQNNGNHHYHSHYYRHHRRLLSW